MLTPHTFVLQAFDPLVEPFWKKQAVILEVPAFQAGCREFESRLPLFGVDRSPCRQVTSRFTRSKQCDEVRGTIFFLRKNRSTTACRVFGTQPASPWWTACPKKGCRKAFLDRHPAPKKRCRKEFKRGHPVL